MRGILKPEHRAAHAREFADVDALYVARIQSLGDTRSLGVAHRLEHRDLRAVGKRCDRLVDDTVGHELQICTDVIEIRHDVSHFEFVHVDFFRALDDDEVSRFEAVRLVPVHTVGKHGHQPYRRLAEIGIALVTRRQQY